MIKVSIVVPIYNVEKYLRECLDSAVNQTLDDIEIICVNDGSTDSSKDILKEYEKMYSNLIVIDQKNKGLGGARNTGINNARGKYIYFLDSDDYIELDAMQICYEECEKNRLDILTFDAECFYDKEYSGYLMNEDYDRRSKLDNEIITGREFYIKSNKKNVYKAPVWLNVYKLKFIKDNSLFFIEDMIHEDEVHTFESLLEAKRVKYINNKFFKRRFRNDSIMTKGSNRKRIDGNIKTINELYSRLLIEKNNEVLANVIEYNINLFLKRAVWHADNLLEFEKKKELEKIKKSMQTNLDIYIQTDIAISAPNLIYLKV